MSAVPERQLFKRIRLDQEQAEPSSKRSCDQEEETADAAEDGGAPAQSSSDKVRCYWLYKVGKASSFRCFILRSFPPIPMSITVMLIVMLRF